MRICLRPASRCPVKLRRGLTLPELLASILILSLIAGSLAGVASAVRSSNTYCSGQTQAAQHGRVAVARIEKNLAACTANENFPGCRVFATTVSGSTFPDVLIVWKPQSTAVDPTGLPRVNELVLYTFNHSSPSELVEIREPANSAAAPTWTSTSAWNTLVSTLISSKTATRTVLTNRLHTASPAGQTATRGAVRFLVLAGPSDTQLAQYRAGTLAWGNLDWPLDWYGSTSGTRVLACQIELLINATDEATTSGHIVPFFGSGAFTYQISR